jgi:hypothetical protein
MVRTEHRKAQALADRATAAAYPELVLISKGQFPAVSYVNSKPQSSKHLSFPHAFSGNPGETLTGPPIKTFGGECARDGATSAR